MFQNHSSDSSFSLMLLRRSSTQVTGEMLEKQLRWCSIRHQYCQCWTHFKLRLPDL